MKEEVQKIKEKNSEFAPGLTIVQVKNIIPFSLDFE